MFTHSLNVHFFEDTMHTTLLDKGVDSNWTLSSCLPHRVTSGQRRRVLERQITISSCIQRQHQTKWIVYRVLVTMPASCRLHSKQSNVKQSNIRQSPLQLQLFSIYLLSFMVFCLTDITILPATITGLLSHKDNHATSYHYWFADSIR